MPAFRDITGQRFGRLTVVRLSHMDRHGGSMWDCLCDCGTEKVIRGNALLNGKVLSCKCLHREQLGALRRTHGRGRTAAYKRWTAMKQRCSNPKDPQFSEYGGRGITVCDRWRDSFEAFLEDMGEPPPGMLLDRIDNDGNYELGNCRWATIEQSNDNRRRVGRKPADIAGQRFGKLVAVRFSHVKDGHAVWVCRCDCGGEALASGSNLKGGSIASCGCLRRRKKT